MNASVLRRELLIRKSRPAIAKCRANGMRWLRGSRLSMKHWPPRTNRRNRKVPPTASPIELLRCAKNVLIFSDGTGQAGGLRFDENRTNIYKLFRATRCGPDSTIDPREQVAFYDPGLGSPADGSHLGWRILRWVHNKVAQATGFGITRNIIDCYAALIQLWEPGDRIFLFGFSRGAYTVRCLAGVIAFCGIPRHPPKQPGQTLKIDSSSAEKLASDAVRHVYQFTYPRKMADATPRQKFLLETRAKLAARFREECGSGSGPDLANVYPHFIGVFDTVASLGNPITTTMFSAVFLLFAAALGLFGNSFRSLMKCQPSDGFWVILRFRMSLSRYLSLPCLAPSGSIWLLI